MSAVRRWYWIFTTLLLSPLLHAADLGNIPLGLLNQLSPDQQAAAMKLLQGQQSGTMQQTQIGPQFPTLIQPPPAERPLSPLEQRYSSSIPANQITIQGPLLPVTMPPAQTPGAPTTAPGAAVPQFPQGITPGALPTSIPSTLTGQFPVTAPMIPGITPSPISGVMPTTSPTTTIPTAAPTSAPTISAPAPAPLRQFGYDLFAGVPTTFAPATDIPVPSDYVIGPGDTVQVQIYGKDNNEYSLVVTRDGSLQFPGIGVIAVTGLSYEELVATLQSRISHQMIGAKANITMGPLRSIRVFVLGDVEHPGSYTVSGLSTMTNALLVSGGIDPVGSLRSVQLKRAGKLITEMDLYDLLLKGDTSADARLLPGDVIFVPPIGVTAAVSGEVKRPAIYELKNEQTVGEVLALAGGLLPTAYSKEIQVERIDKRSTRTIVDLDITKADAMTQPVQDGDILSVYSVLDKMENVVLLTGYVQRPGGYEWRDGMRLSDLITSADALLPAPDLDYVLIRRELPPDRRVEVLSASLRAAYAAPHSDDDVALQTRDQVMVFSSTADRNDAIDQVIAELKVQAHNGAPAPVVTINGRVQFAGDYPLEAGMHLNDLIRAGGNLSEAAYTLQAEVTRYEIVDNKIRETQHIPVDLAAVLRGDAKDNLALQPHDVLTIKELPQWGEQESVELRGEVRFPGRYPITRGETLSKVLARAGGLTKFAYPQGAVFMRDELRQREQQQMDEMREQLNEELASLALEQTQATDTQKTQSVFALKDISRQLETVKASGRLVIDLPAIAAGNADADVVLKAGDTLVVPAATQEVTVIGEVFHPTSHLYQSGLERDDYISQSGGLTNKADDGRIYVVRANGSVMTGPSSSWFGDKEGKIKPGDTIVVPLDVERLRPLTLWTSVSQIFYQFGLAIAAWHTIGVIN